MDKDANLPPRHDLTFIAIIFVFFRGLVYLSARDVPRQFIERWSGWDGVHYVNIAKYGYLTTSIPQDHVVFMSRFPPLYSSLIALLSRVTGVPEQVSGIALSLVFFYMASVLLFALMDAHFKDRQKAFAAVILLNSFPTSYFAGAVYSEALYIFLSLLYFWAIVRYKNYLFATCVAVAMVWTRTAGIAIMVAHLFVAISYFRSGNLKPRTVFYLTAPVLAFVLHQAAIYFLLKQPGYYGASAVHTPLTVARPFTEAWAIVTSMLPSRTALSSFAAWMPYGFAAFFLVAAVGVILWGYNAVPAMYLLYGGAYIFQISMIKNNMSGPRLVFAAFPLFMILAVKMHRIAFGILSLLSIYGLLTFSRMFAQGSWAF